MGARSNRCVTTPTGPAHDGPARSTVTYTVTSPRAAQARAQDEVVGRAGADGQAHLAEALAVGEHVLDERAQGREADAARDDQQVASLRGVRGPAAPQGPAQPDLGAVGQVGESAGRRTR